MSIHLWRPSSQKKSQLVGESSISYLSAGKKPVCSVQPPLVFKIGALAPTEGSPFNWCEASNPSTPDRKDVRLRTTFAATDSGGIEGGHRKKLGYFMGGLEMEG